MPQPAASTLPLSRRLGIVSLALGILAAVSLWQRLRLGYNGPYLDESDYLYVARLLKAGHPWNTYEYMFSSQVPLHVLGIGDSLGGLHGARAVAALLGLCSLGFVFGATRALFRSTPVAGWTVVLFSLQAPHLFISKLATYDVVSFCCFTGSLWLLIAGLKRPHRGWLWCLASSIVFAVAVLSKYVVIVQAPILALVVAIRRPRWLLAALLPCGLVLAAYVYQHRTDLGVLYEHQVVHAHTANATRLDVLCIAAAYCAPMLVLALAGLAVQIRRTGAAWRALRLHVTLLLLALPLIAMHVRSADMVSMFKHMTYPLLALTPLAARLLHRMARRHLVLPLAITAALGGLGLVQTHDMERSFPDLEPMIAYLRPRMAPSVTILSEESYVFRYAFAGSDYGANLYEFNWFDNDGDGQRMPEDVIAAISDGKPDYVMTYSQLTPELTELLRAEVLPHRYRKVFEQPYAVSTVMGWHTHGTVELWQRIGAYTGPYPL